MTEKKLLDEAFALLGEQVVLNRILVRRAEVAEAALIQQADPFENTAVKDGDDAS